MSLEASIVVYEDKPKLEKLLKAGSSWILQHCDEIRANFSYSKLVSILEALAARQDAKPPRVKAFVAYGYTPAAGDILGDRGAIPWESLWILRGERCFCLE